MINLKQIFPQRIKTIKTLPRTVLEASTIFSVNCLFTPEVPKAQKNILQDFRHNCNPKPYLFVDKDGIYKISAIVFNASNNTLRPKTKLELNGKTAGLLFIPSKKDKKAVIYCGKIKLQKGFYSFKLTDTRKGLVIHNISINYAQTQN